jgi:hypothetical protein
VECDENDARAEDAGDEGPAVGEEARVGRGDLDGLLSSGEGIAPGVASELRRLYRYAAEMVEPGTLLTWLLPDEGIQL